MTDNPPLIEIEFHADRLHEDTAYQAISAITDMAMSACSASVAELDLCDTALREILVAIDEQTAVTSARLWPETGQIEICTDEPVSLPDDSRELIELGLGELDERPTRFRGTLAFGRSRS